MVWLIFRFIVVLLEDIICLGDQLWTSQVHNSNFNCCILTFDKGTQQCDCRSITVDYGNSRPTEFE
jgi:hypothetical protein